jgi:hypothetical protein
MAVPARPVSPQSPVKSP